MARVDVENLDKQYQFDKMTPEQRAEYGRKGGIASGETKRRKKAIKETLEVFLGMQMKNGKAANIEEVKSFAALKKKNISVQEAVVISMIQKAMKGDVKAAEWVRDTVGEKPTEVVSMNGSINNPFEGLSTDELKKLIDSE